MNDAERILVLWEALRQIRDGEPKPDASDIEAGVYPMVNRSHEVHLYQRIAERVLNETGCPE